MSVEIKQNMLHAGATLNEEDMKSLTHNHPELRHYVLYGVLQSTNEQRAISMIDSKEYEINADLFTQSVLQNRPAVMKHLQNMDCPANISALGIAVGRENYALADWILPKINTKSSRAYFDAVMWDKPNGIEYLHKHGFPLEANLLTAAFEYPSYGAVYMLHKLNCPYDPAVFEKLKEYGFRKGMCILHALGYSAPWPNGHMASNCYNQECLDFIANVHPAQDTLWYGDDEV